MSSYKDTFEANTFEANTFASGGWRGAGALLSTSGVFTVTSIEANRQLNAGSFTFNQLKNFVGTMIYDYQEGNWDYSNYVVSGNSDLLVFSATSFTLNQLANAIATAYTQNNRDVFWVQDYVLTYSESLTEDLASITPIQLAHLTASFLNWVLEVNADSIARSDFAAVGEEAGGWCAGAVAVDEYLPAEMLEAVGVAE